MITTLYLLIKVRSVNFQHSKLFGFIAARAWGTPAFLAESPLSERISKLFQHKAGRGRCRTLHLLIMKFLFSYSTNLSRSLWQQLCLCCVLTIYTHTHTQSLDLPTNSVSGSFFSSFSRSLEKVLNTIRHKIDPSGTLLWNGLWVD